MARIRTSEGHWKAIFVVDEAMKEPSSDHFRFGINSSPTATSFLFLSSHHKLELIKSSTTMAPPTRTFGLLSLGLSCFINLAGAASSGCNDACYSAIATYNDIEPYSGNGICYKWLSGYPPAQTTQTYTQTPYMAYVSTTTYTTRTETVWTLASGTAAPASTSDSASTSATAAAKIKRIGKPNARLYKRQDSTAGAETTMTTSVAGLPLPNSNIATSCSNNPQSFASACSCIGDDAQTHYAYVTSTISSTSTAPELTRECTTTITSDACAATATYGLQATRLRFGDSGLTDAAVPVIVSNSSSAASCCQACFSSTQNCRYFTYTPPSNATTDDPIPDGGSCALDLEGDSCPVNQLPSNFEGPEYNYITEGEYDADLGSNDGALYGFGPCAQEVPYFYGYGRAGAGTCTTDISVTTVSS